MSGLLKHPRGLFVLFFAEMWERFSYYGMRALLVFYLTETFLFSDTKSYGIYGSYTALVYLAPVFGGLLADRILGYRKAVILGASLMAAGHFCMAIERIPVFYFAIALLIVGNGFFKANISTIVGRLYEPGDPRRDGGFTIFYIAVNVGAAAAPIACGWVGGTYGWNWGFTLAGIGMVLGLINFIAGQHRFEGKADLAPDTSPGTPVVASASRDWMVYVGSLIGVLLIWKLVQHPTLVGWTLLGIGIAVFVALIVYSLLQTQGMTRHRMWVALTLTVISVVFWAFFEQAGSSLNLFADRNVDTSVMGQAVPAPVMQSINPIFIVLFGPLFAMMWVALDRKKLQPSIPLKFGIGIVLLGIGFGLLYQGASISQQTGIVALQWLVLGYLFHTLGELCLSPVGLSMITKLSPPGITGLMMGTWFLAISFAQYAAAVIAVFTSVEGVAEGVSPSPVDTVMVYGSVFGRIGLVALVVGLGTMAIAPLLNRGTHGIK